MVRALEKECYRVSIGAFKFSKKCLESSHTHRYTYKFNLFGKSPAENIFNDLRIDISSDITQPFL